jgi:Uma2 family endonuclease
LENLTIALTFEQNNVMQASFAKPTLPKSRKKILTYDDYAALTPAGSGLYELQNGKIIEMPSPTPSHQRVAKQLFKKMDAFIEQHQLGELFFAPLDTVFDQTNTFQPDILFISKNRKAIIQEKKIEGAPDLVVEILSDGNTAKEMSYKKYIYESSGVLEYWIVNLLKQTVTVYNNIEGELLPSGIFPPSEKAISQILSGFDLPVSDLFG